ncbi:pol protein [Cucumis melo var. makuwa]|uniref:Pol protein n=1 Tax=Cucumis melo var. makuwa TaxID=1194695 RepID=A0A5D3C1G8_CUCMM|nr:pol protein [Cucumis melo var. makuwa]TYK05205.1 pol protein [Cucumis melo var. makuwa]
MRQQRWLELVNDYDCEILYHPGKANVVADALSKKVSHSAALITRQTPLYQDFERVEIAVSRCLAEAGYAVEFSVSPDGGFLFKRRLCVLADSVVKIELLTEAHSSRFSMHPGLPNQHTSFRENSLILLFGKGLQAAMGTRLDFSIAFNPQIDGQTERLNHVLEDMLRACALQFPGSWDSHLHLMKFAYNNSFQVTISMTSFEALYGKCCRSPICWDETAQSRHKSYADVRRKDLEFDVGDKVFLKVAPMKGVLRFEKKGKLSPRFVGSFEILERIGPVVYRLALPPSLSIVHDVRHVSMLRKYVSDPSHVVDYKPLEADENLSYTKQPIEILAREVNMLRNREIALIKVLWRNHKVEEATWEREDDTRARYPELFEE